MSTQAAKLRALARTLIEHSQVLRQEALEIEARLNKNQNARLPAVRLPPEILGHIFNMVLFSEPLYQFALLSRQLTRARQYLMSTCSHWRSVTLTTTSLWSRVVFDRQTKSHILLRNLERAGSRPLDLFLPAQSAAPPLPGLADVPEIQTAFRRCRVLSAGSGYLIPTLRAGVLQSPYLRTAILANVELDDTKAEEFDFREAKSLRYLWIATRSYRIAPTLTVITESSITRLHLDVDMGHGMMDLTGIIDLLNGCPLLEICELRVGLKEGAPSSVSSPELRPLVNLQHFACDARLLARLAGSLKAPNVTVLNIFLPAMFTTPNIYSLRHLYLPALHCLEVGDGHHDSAPFYLPDIMAFIQGNPTITKVAFDVKSSEGLMDYIVQHPLPTQITDLWIWSARITAPQLPQYWSSHFRQDSTLRRPVTIHVRDMWLRGHHSGHTLFRSAFQSIGSNIEWKAEDYPNSWDWRNDVCGLFGDK